jgi:hypothetical protein
MVAFLAGVAALVVLILGVRLLARADPQRLAAVLRKVCGVILLGLAIFLTARGALPIAIPLAAFGFALLGIPLGSLFGGSSPYGTARKTPGQKSGVRSDWLEMELDHDSGDLDGRCLKGRFAGRDLSSLSDGELLELLRELRAGDHQGALLLEAFLDFRTPKWRDSEEDGRTETQPAKGRMSRDEALAVLGLKAGASEEEIRAAHRKLMLKLHPDQGGSNYLAARINEAKDVLLG